MSTVAIGLFAESVAFDWADLRGWVPDLAVGWLLAGCGLVAIGLVRTSRVGLLMVAAGLAWFVGNFEGSQPSSLDGLARHGKFVYLAVLVQATLATLPAVASSRRVGVVVAAYLVVLWPGDSPTGVAVRVMVLGVVALCMTAWAGFRAGRGFTPRRRAASIGPALLALALIGVSVARLVLPAVSYDDVTLSFDLALCLVAGVLLVQLAMVASEREHVADLVVELGERRSTSIRDALRRTLGDPTLEIGYRLADAETYVEQAGRTLSLPSSNSRSVVTPLGEDIVLLHDRSLLADEQTVAAVTAAAELAATNARLQAELRAQIAELRASRRRIAVAGEEGRRRIKEDLRKGVEERLAAIAESLLAVQASTPQLEDELGRSRELLSHARSDLRSLASGLHPRAVAEEGLAAAVSRLAVLAPVPVEVSVSVDELGAAVEAAAYFVCSEALANVAKHSGAAAASVSIAQHPEAVRVVVADDGVGGADRTGSGLRGLAERVEGLGGSLRVASPVGGGTHLVADIPVGDEAVELTRS